MKTQWIDYKQGNTALSGYLIYDDAVQGRRPAVLMIHDRSGFSPNTLADAQMIAKLGYVVFAEDIFGKGEAPKQCCLIGPLKFGLVAKTLNMPFGLCSN